MTSPQNDNMIISYFTEVTVEFYQFAIFRFLSHF